MVSLERLSRPINKASRAAAVFRRQTLLLRRLAPPCRPRARRGPSPISGGDAGSARGGSNGFGGGGAVGADGGSNVAISGTIFWRSEGNDGRVWL